MNNFVSNSDAQALFEVVGKKKLTIVDVMPTADESNVGIPYIYIGADTQDYEKGGVYKCQEVTPATDPKTYEHIKIFTVKVDLSLYKKIYGGTVDAWNLLTDEQKAQYDYTFFDGDSNDYFAVVDAVTDGDMHPVTSNAVAEEVEDFDAEISDIVNVYGAKNILSYPYTDTTGTWNNVTFTDFGDGTVGIAASAQTTTNVWFNFTPYQSDGSDWRTLKAGRYIISGATEDAYIAIQFDNNGGVEYSTNGEETISFVIDTDKKFKMFIHIPSGKLPSLTMKPMLRLATIKDDTWEPYAKTNKELTDALKHKILATANANQTWGTQIASLKSTYQALSNEEKKRCFLRNGNDGIIFLNHYISLGLFTATWANNGSWGIYTLNMTDSRYSACTNGTVTDSSNVNNTLALNLMMTT